MTGGSRNFKSLKEAKSRPCSNCGKAFKQTVKRRLLCGRCFKQA